MGDDESGENDSLFGDNADASASIADAEDAAPSKAPSAKTAPVAASKEYNEADIDAEIDDSDDEEKPPSTKPPSVRASSTPAAKASPPKQDSGMSDDFNSAEIDNSPAAPVSKPASASPSPVPSRPESRQQKAPSKTASGEDSLFDDDDKASDAGRGSIQQEPSLAALKGANSVKTPGAMSARASVASLPEPTPSDSVDFNARANARSSASPSPPPPPPPPVDNYAKGVAVDLGSSGVSAVGSLPEHLKEQEAKRLALLNPVGPRPGTVANAKAAAAAAVDAAGLSFGDKRTGLDLPSPLTLFRIYDVDMGGAINRAEFSRMLYELDGLGEVPPGVEPDNFRKKRDKYVEEQFDKWDLNHDDMISIDEFYLFFYTELCFKFPLLRTGVNPGADLFNIFVKYCSFGKSQRLEQMSSHQFAKLCKDCKLINGTTVTQSICDIIYCRSKAELEGLEDFKRKHGEYITNKMLYPQFLYALMYLANKRKSGFQEVVSRILDNVSALPPASMSDLVIFRNNGTEEQKEEYLERPRGLPRVLHNVSDTTERLRKEAEMAQAYGISAPPKLLGASMGGSIGPTSRNVSYSGAPPADEYADDKFEANGDSGGLPTPKAGGPMGAARITKKFMTESEVLPDASKMASVATAEQLKKWGLKDSGVVSLPAQGQQGLDNPEAMMTVRDMNHDTLLMALKRVFELYALWEGGMNRGSLDKIRFHKILRDTRMVTEGIPGGLSSATVDKIYYKVLPPAKSTLNFVQFVETLRHVSNVQRSTLNEVMERIVIMQGPINTKVYN